MILYAASDLLWATRIKATADKLGVPCRPVRSIEMLEARLGEGGVTGVLLDLEASELAFAILDRLAGNESITTVAWGPHVEVDLLAEAGRRGCRRVMARGQFANDLPEILIQLSST